MRRAEGKVAIITGGAMGMGEAHALAIAKEGGKVVIGDIAVEQGRKLAGAIGRHALFCELDVTSAASWSAVISKTEATFGPITTLVNNAGIVDVGPIDTMAPSAFQKAMDVNVMGSLLGIQAVVPSMRSAGGGAIVNISSCAGLVPLPAMASYVASKFALTGLSKVASLDLACDKIRVNSIHPGAIETPMTAGSEPPTRQAIPRKGRTDEVAAMVLFLISDEASYCTGAEYVVDGGWLNVVGEVAADFQLNKC